MLSRLILEYGVNPEWLLLTILLDFIIILYIVYIISDTIKYMKE